MAIRRALTQHLPERLSRGVPKAYFQSVSLDFRCHHKVALHGGNWKGLDCHGIPFLQAQSALLQKAGRRQANEIDAAACLDPDVNHPAFRRHAWEVDNLYDLAFQRPQVDSPIGRATVLRLGTGSRIHGRSTMVAAVVPISTAVMAAVVCESCS